MRYQAYNNNNLIIEACACSAWQVNKGNNWAMAPTLLETGVSFSTFRGYSYTLKVKKSYVKYTARNPTRAILPQT